MPFAFPCSRWPNELQHCTPIVVSCRSAQPPRLRRHKFLSFSCLYIMNTGSLSLPACSFFFIRGMFVLIMVYIPRWGCDSSAIVSLHACLRVIDDRCRGHVWLSFELAL